MKKLYYTNGKLGFDFEDFFITDPFTSTCCRFDVDPIKEYGLTEKQVKRFKIEEDIKKGELNYVSSRLTYWTQQEKKAKRYIKKYNKMMKRLEEGGKIQWKSQ